MRSITFIALLFLSISSIRATSPAANAGSLDGTWVPVKQEMGGNALPPAVYTPQRLIISGDAYSVTAESVDKGSIEYDTEKMDIYGKDGVNAGKHFTAIYKIENGQLTICYNLKGDQYPGAFDTKGKPMYFMSVFKK
jgi:uncharacterized protein (TIGR03067 family)